MTNKADQTCFLMLLFVSCPRYFLACLVTEQTTIQDLVSPKKHYFSLFDDRCWYNNHKECSKCAKKEQLEHQVKRLLRRSHEKATHLQRWTQKNASKKWSRATQKTDLQYMNTIKELSPSFTAPGDPREMSLARTNPLQSPPPDSLPRGCFCDETKTGCEGDWPRARPRQFHYSTLIALVDFKQLLSHACE